MQTKLKLIDTLKIIDGRGYKAYKELQNNWYDFDHYLLGIPYVQGDPFASPSSVIIKIEQKEAAFPDWYLKKEIRVTALEDYLTRYLEQLINQHAKGNRGSGKSGQIQIIRTGQEVIKRTAVEVNPENIEVRLQVGLPARGRRVLGIQAVKMLTEEIAAVVENGLYYRQLNQEQLKRHVQTIEEQQLLRKMLAEKELVAFVANGSILPRRSGIDDRPLKNNEVVPFVAPAEFEVEFELPYRGKIKGMGISKGITLIVGGGYHGKSTLLQAVERGVYNHIPEDGREYVVSRQDAVKIRAEDGRRVEKVDISPFINNLPGGESTTNFTTENASGSTSQAANIMEALEIGTELLLIDEDTCATNFMIRDARMQRLVTGSKEPITPFIDRVKPLYDQHQVSTIIVVGGAGDYFDVADQVIMLDQYVPGSVTERAAAIAEELPSLREVDTDASFGQIKGRIPDPDSIDPYKGRKIKVKVRGKYLIQLGRENIDLSYLEQLIDSGQSRAIADLLVYGLKEDIIDGKRTVAEMIDILYDRIAEQGLKVISPFNYPAGDYVLPRPFELGAALNRLRSLRVK